LLTNPFKILVSQSKYSHQGIPQGIPVLSFNLKYDILLLIGRNELQKSYDFITDGKDLIPKLFCNDL